MLAIAQTPDPNTLSNACQVGSNPCSDLPVTQTWLHAWMVYLAVFVILLILLGIVVKVKRHKK